MLPGPCSHSAEPLQQLCSLFSIMFHVIEIFLLTWVAEPLDEPAVSRLWKGEETWCPWEAISQVVILTESLNLHLQCLWCWKGKVIFSASNPFWRLTYDKSFEICWNPSAHVNSPLREGQSLQMADHVTDKGHHCHCSSELEKSNSGHWRVSEEASCVWTSPWHQGNGGVGAAEMGQNYFWSLEIPG